MEELKFTVTYNGNTYNYTFGSEIYIFHTGIYNEMHKKYSMKTLLKYVNLVQECYLEDSNRTPLGELADYVANNWKTVKKLDVCTLLDKFYIEN